MLKAAVWMCVLALVCDPALCRVLNDFIRHFEPLHYNDGDLMWHHHRVRRSMMGPNEVELGFRAFDRDFNIILEPERKLFHPDFRFIRNGKRETKHDIFSHIYSGYEASDPDSRVYGNLAHGVFDGTVETAHGVYYIEPARRYHAHFNKTDQFHSIIYRQSDLNTSSITGATCGSADHTIQRTMLRFQQRTGTKGRGLRRNHTLRKRQAGERNRCTLRVVLDYKLFKELDGNMEVPSAVVMSILLGGSAVFEGTDFDGDGVDDGINFSVRDFIQEDRPPALGTFYDNPFIGVSAFLNEHSQANYSDYCLSYRFTYRDFEGGVVGLAYIAPQPGENLRGGICDNFGGGSTLNTGIVTSENFGRRIPPGLSALTFAHEAGHNFGSQHDEGTPPADGAYIMHAFATDGSRENNREFSPASIRMMRNSMSSNGDCFVEESNNCGNMLLDADEECDCGSAGNQDENGVCLRDSCCFGRNCTLIATLQCSPDQGLCCDASTCMFVPEAANQECSGDTECALNQTCGGNSSLCPTAVAKEIPTDPGYLLCENSTGICNGPSCNGTLCSILSLMPCECINETQVCHVCCRLTSGVCISTIDIAAADSLPGLQALLPDRMGRNKTVGTPCSNFTGYCDILNNCLPVDENGALFRLGNLFFNSEGLRRFITFASNMWWVLVIVAVVVLVALFFLVMCIHCLLPRPKTVQNRNKRRTLKREQQIRVRESQTTQQPPPGNYPQNYAQYAQS